MKNFILAGVVTVLTATVALGADVITKVDSYTVGIAKTTYQTFSVSELKTMRTRLETEILSAEQVVTRLENLLANVDAQLASAASLGVTEKAEATEK